jgi:hypothetical protein
MTSPLAQAKGVVAFICPPLVAKKNVVVENGHHRGALPGGRPGGGVLDRSDGITDLGVFRSQ